MRKNKVKPNKRRLIARFLVICLIFILANINAYAGVFGNGAGKGYEENSDKFLNNKSNKEKNNEIYQQQFNC